MTSRYPVSLLVMALLSFAPQALAQTGLIEHLPLNGTGSALVGTSGTLVNGPVAAADRFGSPGGALAFTGGSQQYVSVAGGGGLNNRQTGTISMYVKWIGPQKPGVMSNGNVVARQFNGVFSNQVVGLSAPSPSTSRVTWQPYNAGPPVIIGTTIVGDDQWHHVAITYSPGSHKLYLDGVLDGSSSATGTIGDAPSLPLAIGAWSGDGQGYSTSVIDDFKVFNRVLTQTEIQGINPPTAVAGVDRAVFDRDENGIRTTVALDGTASSDPDLAPLTYSWMQTGGPAVALTGANTATPTFLAPDMSNHPTGEPTPIALTFRLTVNDGVFNSGADDVVITVKHFNLPARAVASAPTTAVEGTSVTLDGSASSDGDQDPLSYLWTQTSGTPVNLPLVATNNPTLDFTAPVITAPHSFAGETLQFMLTVSDGIATDTTDVSIFIQNVNQPPMVADIPPADPVFDNAGLVTLNASGADPDDDAVSFRWEQIAGTPVTLNNANTATASFIAPAVTPAQGSVTLTFQCTANDASFAGDPVALDSAPATVDVLVTHANRAPIADAGPNADVPEVTMVTLDGHNSYDPDLDPITYAWVQTGGTPVELDTYDSAHPTFLTPEVGPAGATLTFQLRVSDLPVAGSGANLTSAPSTVTLTVKDTNRPPTALAGQNQTVNEGTVVSLDGSQSSDPDGNTFTYQWTQTSGPLVADLSDATAAKPTFSAPAVDRFGGTVVFSLQTTDQFGARSNVVTTSVAVRNINQAPVADAGPLRTVQGDTDVTLTGAGSDPDTEEQPLLSYVWKQTSGTSVKLVDANTPNLIFHAPWVRMGRKITLKFQLTVTDPNGAAASANTTVLVTNESHAPVADAGGVICADEGVLVDLDGTGSRDPDGDTLTYAWVQTAGPTVTLAGALTATPTFTAPFVRFAGALLKFQLTVSDGSSETSSDTAIVFVKNINTPPILVNPRASVSTLWPPNHRMVPVEILGVVDLNCNATITITRVTQDEATNGLGDGDTAVDAIINTNGTVLLRAERAGNGNGRVYHVHFTASDFEGSVSGMVKVSVPKNKATDGVIDGGELFDSTR